MFKYLLFFLMLLPILILAYISIVPYTETLGEQIKAGNLATAQEVSYLVAEHFNWSIKVGNYFVSTPRLVYSVENKDRKGAEERLALLMAAVPDIDRAYLTTPEGILWVDYPPSPEIWGKNMSYRDWYKGVSRDWHPYVSEVYLRDVEPKRYVVSVALPIKNDSRVIGVVVMQHRLETVQKWVAPVRLGKSGVIYIVDKNGRVVAHPKEDPKQPPDYSSVPVVEKVKRGVEGVEEVYDPVENKTMLSAYVPVRGTGMGVIAQQPTEEAFAAVKLHTNLSLILIALTGIFAVFVARAYDSNRELYRKLTVQHKELEKRTEELSTLYEVDRVTSRTLNLDEVMTSALNKLIEVTGVDSGDVYLMDEKSGELILKGQKGISSEVVPLIERLKIGEGVAGAAVQQGDIIIINDIDKAPHSMTVYSRKTGARSLVSVPIKVRDRILGVLDLVSHTPRSFAIEEIELLKSIATQIGIAVEKASFYEDLKMTNLELEKRLKELEEFSEIAIGRELRMIELKKEIEELREKIKKLEGNV
jgi:putative methionine-R-sulfoxide reductase with GAF domain